MKTTFGEIGRCRDHPFGTAIFARLVCAIFALGLIAAADTPYTVGTADSQKYLNDIKALTTPAMELCANEIAGNSTSAATTAAPMSALRIERMMRTSKREPTPQTATPERDNARGGKRATRMVTSAPPS